MLKDSALRQLQAEFVVLVNFWSSDIFVNNSTSDLVLNFVHSNFPGGILRQCLRLVCTCAVRNCLECKEKMTPSSSASQNRQVMPSSSSQQTVEETNSSRVSNCLEFFAAILVFSKLWRRWLKWSSVRLWVPWVVSSVPTRTVPLWSESNLIRPKLEADHCASIFLLFPIKINWKFGADKLSVPRIGNSSNVSGRS